MTTDTFSEDVAVRLQEQLEWERRIKRAVEIEEIKEEVYMPRIVPIPYTPPVTVWRPSTATLRAFAAQCIKSMLP